MACASRSIPSAHFSGRLLGIGLMALFAGDFRTVFWFALIPGAIAVSILILFVREPERKPNGPAPKFPLRAGELAGLGGLFWGVVAVGTVLTLARFSEAFLVLRAEGAGLHLALIPLVLIVMNVVYSLAAYPFGALSDHVDKRLILAAGFAVLIAADLVLAFAPNLSSSWPASRSGACTWA
jgi:predicted MFS family arabinose efflux permease